jgi:hypothetical protein
MTRNFVLLFIIAGATIAFAQLSQPAAAPVRTGYRSEADNSFFSPASILRSSSEDTNSADASGEPYTDHRAWQHGIDLVPVGNRWLIVWSSWGNPPSPQPAPDGDWSHDVYYSWLDPRNPVLDPQTLASDEEAQEPASTAINSEGHILMSCEDGKGDINQHAGLFDQNLNPIKPYPFTVRDGGHSGHVAAMGDKFLTVYSEGWIDGGGVDNLGTGDDVWARIIDSNGNEGVEIPVSVDKSPDHRDWWPVVGASDHNWLQVWQRYPSATLHGAIISADGKIMKNIDITDNIKFYYYNVKYLPSLKLYAVFGSREDGGFVSLIDTEGNVKLTKTGLPDTVRESKLIVQGKGKTLTAVYPTLPTGAAVLKITDHSIDLTKNIPDSYEWDYMGTDGLFVDKHKVLFTTLSKEGLQFVTINGI